MSDARLDRRRPPQRLKHDAIAFGQPEQRVELRLRRVGVEFELSRMSENPTGASWRPRACRGSRDRLRPAPSRAIRRPARWRPPSGSPRRRRPALRAACRRSRARRRCRRSRDEGRPRRASGRSRPCRRSRLSRARRCALSVMRRPGFGAVAVLERRLDRAQLVGVHVRSSVVARRRGLALRTGADATAPLSPSTRRARAFPA